MENIQVMLERLRALEEEHSVLSEQVLNAALMTQKKEYAKVAKRHASIGSIVEKYHLLLKLQEHIEEAKIMSQDSDEEMADMARLEL